MGATTRAASSGGHGLTTLNRLEFVAPLANEPLRYSRLDSPVGELLLVADRRGLRGLHLDGARYVPTLPADAIPDDVALAEVAAQLADYFMGRRRHFSLTVAPVGTPFQLEVWRALAAIPCGETDSYGALAARLGRPAAARAVGAANGQNPISIIIPCHRLIGANGSLTDYAGGLDRKAALLALERGGDTRRAG
jgi:methylated-DNA-[protein]-cysteine S-methyltransferase